MCLFVWTLDFRLENLKITHAQMWLRMHSFRLDYWISTTLISIAYGIRTHLSIDELTRKITLEHFVHVEIGLNMSDTLYDRILVKQEGYALFVELEYQSLPNFYDHIVHVGHSIDKCGS